MSEKFYFDSEVTFSNPSDYNLVVLEFNAAFPGLFTKTQGEYISNVVFLDNSQNTSSVTRNLRTLLNDAHERSMRMVAKDDRHWPSSSLIIQNLSQRGIVRKMDFLSVYNYALSDSMRFMYLELYGSKKLSEGVSEFTFNSDRADEIRKVTKSFTDAMERVFMDNQRLLDREAQLVRSFGSKENVLERIGKLLDYDKIAVFYAAECLDAIHPYMSDFDMKVCKKMASTLSAPSDGLKLFNTYLNRFQPLRHLNEVTSNSVRNYYNKKLRDLYSVYGS